MEVWAEPIVTSKTCIGQILQYKVGGAIIRQIVTKQMLCAILFIVFHIDISGSRRIFTYATKMSSIFCSFCQHMGFLILKWAVPVVFFSHK